MLKQDTYLFEVLEDKLGEPFAEWIYFGENMECHCHEMKFLGCSIREQIADEYRQNGEKGCRMHLWRVAFNIDIDNELRVAENKKRQWLRKKAELQLAWRWVEVKILERSAIGVLLDAL